jgi:hypothetical protein
METSVPVQTKSHLFHVLFFTVNKQRSVCLKVQVYFVSGKNNAAAALPLQIRCCGYCITLALWTLLNGRLWW